MKKLSREVCKCCIVLVLFSLVVLALPPTSYGRAIPSPWRVKGTNERDKIANMDRQVLDSCLEKVSPSYTMPKSNLDWMFDNLMLAQKKLAPDFDLIMTTRVRGKITGISSRPGEIPLEGKHYYVGRPGFFKYDGKIDMTLDNGKAVEIFLSPKRMKLLRVVTESDQGDVPSSFDAVETGDEIELEETTDLVRPNINDDNIVSISLRILN